MWPSHPQGCTAVCLWGWMGQLSLSLGWYCPMYSLCTGVLQSELCLWRVRTWKCLAKLLRQAKVGESQTSFPGEQWLFNSICFILFVSIWLAFPVWCIWCICNGTDRTWGWLGLKLHCLNSLSSYILTEEANQKYSECQNKCEDFHIFIDKPFRTFRTQEIFYNFVNFITQFRPSHNLLTYLSKKLQ